MAEQCVLAIDLGTSHVKAAVIDRDGAIRGKGRRALEAIRLPDGGAEQDPAAVWTAVEGAATEAVRTADTPPDAVRAILCSAQYSSIVPVDRDGTPLMNLIVWMDTRGGIYNLGLYGEHPDAVEHWLDVHGCPPVPTGNDSLAHMLWIKHERPDVYERTHAFLEPMDFVSAKLTGRTTANQCTTFMMLLTDNRAPDETRYDPDLVRYSGLDEAKLPELVPVGADVGPLRPEAAAALGLPADVRVLSGVNDSQAGSVGTATFQGDHAGVCVGTTSVLLAHVDFKRTDFEHGVLTMPSPIPGRYLVMGENGIGGKALDHFFDHVVFASDQLGALDGTDRYAALGRVVAEAPPGAHSLLFLPWLNGSGAPVYNGNARGGFLNMSLDTTRADMARAVLEGVAFNLRWLADPVQEFVGRPFSHYVFAGGGAESDAWAQILADVLRAPVHQLADARFVNARGTGLLGFYFLGELSLDEVAARCRTRQVFEPRSAHVGRYDTLFTQFLAAYERNADIFESLNA